MEIGVWLLLLLPPALVPGVFAAPVISIRPDLPFRRWSLVGSVWLDGSPPFGKMIFPPLIRTFRRPSRECHRSWLSRMLPSRSTWPASAIPGALNRSKPFLSARR
uniref:Putative secreted peptide n=1 Tax=Anopheles braziliensis TaxID=58242 RepID=A0A2M3ZQK1_9DIPT